MSWGLRRAARVAVSRFCRRFYRDDRGDEIATVLVAGTARSGSTWVGDLIASARPTRIMFEPFHARLVEPYSRFPEFLYQRPTEENGELTLFSQRVFHGRIRDPWIDRQVNCLRPELRVVKEVRVNLLLRWLVDRFPDVRPVVVLRHPCAVVQSRMQVGWTADTDLEAFLSQRNLVEDFLDAKMPLIEAARTEEEKHALVWCISYLIPMRQFGESALPAVFYEDLVCQPERALERLFALAGMPIPDSQTLAARRPSLTAKRQSAVVTGDDPVGRWRGRIAPDRVARIVDIVRAFGLDDLYADAALPLPTARRYLLPA